MKSIYKVFNGTSLAGMVTVPVGKIWKVLLSYTDVTYNSMISIGTPSNGSITLHLGTGGIRAYRQVELILPSGTKVMGTKAYMTGIEIDESELI